MYIGGLEEILRIVDRSLNTKRKKHIAGGILLSVSLLFGALAITVVTLKEDKYDEIK